MRAGNSVSTASTGVFITLMTSSSMALTPSQSGRAPVPPLRISYCAYQRPDTGWRPELDSEPPAALPGAGTRPGTALASARMTTDVVIWLGRTYMLTGAGKRGLSSEPSGGYDTCTGRDRPSFTGSWGIKIIFTRHSMKLRDTHGRRLIGPRACSSLSRMKCRVSPDFSRDA